MAIELKYTTYDLTRDHFTFTVFLNWELVWWICGAIAIYMKDIYDSVKAHSRTMQLDDVYPI